MKLQPIRRLCNRLLVIMLNCWRVNESWTVDITKFLIQKLNAVATNSLLEFGGDECDDLNFMNFNIDSFKIRIISWILGNFKIRKIRFLNLWLKHCLLTGLGFGAETRDVRSLGLASVSRSTCSGLGLGLVWLVSSWARLRRRPDHLRRPKTTSLFGHYKCRTSVESTWTTVQRVLEQWAMSNLYLMMRQTHIKHKTIK